MTAATLLRIAALLALAQGIAHAALIIFAKPRHGAEELAVIQAMKSHRFDFAGAQRSYWDFYFGYALIAAVVCLLEAVLFWLLAGAGAGAAAPGVIHSVAGVFAGYNVVHALLAWRYFFITPIIPDILVAGCLILTVLRAAG